MSVLKFPDGFLFGAATSSHQVEGGNHNDWTEWELGNAERLTRESASKFSYLKNWPEIRAQAENPANYISGKACDHYHRFREDFNVAKQLGHNAHRFSIEWSRIEPEEGKFNEAEIEHYRKVIRALRERGMEPFVTLWHWTNPLWIRDQNGWENPKTVADYERYVRRIVEALDGVRFWMPLNEPSSYIGSSYVVGMLPPQVRSMWRANRVFRNLMAAHRRAYRIVHDISPDVLVGSGSYLTHNEPYRNYPWNRVLARFVSHFRNWRFLDAMQDTQDFIGLQYYHHDALNFKLGKGRWGPIETRNKNEQVNDLDWEIYPEGIYRLIKEITRRYRKPIYITENGTADADDDHRGRFIQKHLAWAGRAIQEGADVRGYFHWSLLDNFEWDKGFWPRFGLVSVDHQTLERKIRPSAWEYKKIIEANSIEVP